MLLITNIAREQNRPLTQQVIVSYYCQWLTKKSCTYSFKLCTYFEGVFSHVFRCKRVPLGILRSSETPLRKTLWLFFFQVNVFRQIVNSCQRTWEQIHLRNTFAMFTKILCTFTARSITSHPNWPHEKPEWISVVSALSQSNCKYLLYLIIITHNIYIHHHLTSTA